MGRKRRKGQDTSDGAELPLEVLPVKLSPAARAAKEHELHLKIRARTAVKAEKDEANRKSNGELDGLDEDIKRIADELLMDTEMQKQRDLFVSPDQARQGLAAVAATARAGHPFVEPAADKIASGEAPRCAFPDCGKFADEAVHVVAPHEYSGEHGGPCACGEPKDSACHQVAAEGSDGKADTATPEGGNNPPAEDDVFRKEPQPTPHQFQDGPLRGEGGVHLCTDCEMPEDAPVHHAADVETPLGHAIDGDQAEEAQEGGGAGA